MPTSHDRIAVTKDPALAEALGRAGPLTKPGTPEARLVHDLAIRGAQAILEARQDDDEAIERLIRRTTGEDPGYDRDVLLEIDRLGWDQQ
jgi:hypothetical protein